LSLAADTDTSPVCFIIKHRTNKICFDCGREFDLPDAQEPKRSVAPPGVRLETNPHHLSRSSPGLFGPAVATMIVDL